MYFFFSLWHKKCNQTLIFLNNGDDAADIHTSTLSPSTDLHDTVRKEESSRDDFESSAVPMMRHVSQSGPNEPVASAELQLLFGPADSYS